MNGLDIITAARWSAACVDLPRVDFNVAVDLGIYLDATGVAGAQILEGDAIMLCSQTYGSTRPNCINQLIITITIP